MSIVLLLFSLQRAGSYGCPVLEIDFGPPTAKSKKHKICANFDVATYFFRSPALWSSQNVFGRHTMVAAIVSFKDWVWSE